MKIMVEMYLSPAGLRRACVDNNWCDCMDNDQYGNMLNLCTNSQAITLDILVKISNRIVNGTYDYLCASDVLDELLNGGYVTYYHRAE